MNKGLLVDVFSLHTWAGTALTNNPSSVSKLCHDILLLILATKTDTAIQS